MSRALLLLVASAPMLACSASMRRGVIATEAATEMQQVTRSRANEFDPAVSPDAKTIAYESADSPDATPHVEVMALRDLGSEDSARIEYSSKDAMGRQPAWMPDGSGLIFESNALGRHRLVQTMGDGPGKTLYLARVGNPRLFAAWPAVSPDGRSMAMSLGPSVLFETGWRTAVPMDSTLGVSDLFGSGVTVLGPGSDPAWSPDGRRIAFARVTGGHAHLFVASRDGSDARQITEGLEDDQEPSWSPDGRFIVFCSAHRSDAGWTQANLFVVEPDGSGMVQLTEGDHLACRPDWGRDGFVYFHANTSDRFHIWRVRPIGAFADAVPR